MTNLHELFSPKGALDRALQGYTPRASQRRVAERIDSALARREVLMVEAGTGTGKTFAYLVPALLSGLRVLISTGTRTLQDQLFMRDIPLLSAALGRPAKVALLKGRSNYLCRTRLMGGVQQELLPRAGQMESLRRWADATRSGDLAEVVSLAENDPLRAQITSTRENCTGMRCGEFARCHVFQARRVALAADIVVVNHHLLLADLALKEDGFGELLPSVDALILDEAHQLPDLACEFFGLHASTRQVELLLQDARRASAARASFRAPLDAAEQSLRDLLTEFGRADRRVAWQDLPASARHATIAVGEAMEMLASSIETSIGDGDEDVELSQTGARARNIESVFRQIDSAGAEEGVRTAVVNARGVSLSLLPYDISARFQGLVRERRAAWIFTSATLALADDFTHFAARLGLQEAESLCVPSPFDFESQSLLYLPANMPDPASEGFPRALLAETAPLLAAAEGGAFLLFTSHRSLSAAARLLRDAGSEHELLVQGEAPRERLLQQFRKSGRAVLLGTASFWEGVDVQGAALRLVIIDKLPFSPLDDPLTRARIEFLESHGGNAFRDFQLPEAALALKQGVGRLIRSERDRGVVVICDPRMTSRGYGRSLLAALPPMRITRDAGETAAFLRQCADDLREEQCAVAAGAVA